MTALFGAESVAVLAATVLVKSTALFALWLLVQRLTRRSGPRAWGSFFVVLGAMPVVAWLAPAWGGGAVAVPHAVLDQSIGGAVVSLSLGSAVVVVWMLGAVLIAARFVRDVGAALGVARRARPAGPRLELLAARVRATVGVTTSVRVATSAEVASPAVLGWRRPVILLPHVVHAWADDDIVAVLCHELAHVRQRDWCSHVGEHLVAAVYWPNPLVHLARRRSAFAREVAADRTALRAGVDPVCFARRILAVARDARPGCAPAAAVALASPAGGTGIERRLRALFDETRPADARPARSRHSVVSQTLLAVPVAFAIATAEPWTCAAPREVRIERCP